MEELKKHVVVGFQDLKISNYIDFLKWVGENGIIYDTNYESSYIIGNSDHRPTMSQGWVVHDLVLTKYDETDIAAMRLLFNVDIRFEDINNYLPVCDGGGLLRVPRMDAE